MSGTLAWTALLLALACWYIRLAVTGDRAYFFNSDMASIELFCRDVAAGRDLSNWQFSGAPSFFPDMALYLAISSVIPGVAWRVLAYGLASILMMTAGWVALWRLSPAGRSGSDNAPMVSSMALGLCAAAWGWLHPSSIYLLAGISHSGVLILLPWVCRSALLLSGVAGPVRGARRTAHACLIWILVTAGCVSDKLMLPQVIAPVTAVLLMLAIKRETAWRSLAGVLALLLTAAAAGFALFKLVAPRALASFYIAHEGSLVEEVLRCFSQWAMLTWSTIPFHATLVLVFALTSIAIAIHAFRSRLDPGLLVPQALAIFFLAGAASSLGAMALTGMTSAENVTRYMMPAFFIPVFWGWPILVQGLSPARTWVTGRRGEMLAASVAVLTILLCAPAFRDVKVLANYRDYYPKDIRHVDSSLARRGLHHGIGGYWSAKQFRCLSRHGVEVVPVLRTMVPYCLVDNWSLYTNRPEFVLIDRSYQHPDHRLNEHEIIARYGSPASAFQHGNLLVMVYDSPANKAFQSMFLELPRQRF